MASLRFLAASISALSIACHSLLAAEVQQPLVPVVFVPGLLGSRLLDPVGEPVWEGGLADLQHLRALALPRDPVDDPLQPSGIINRHWLLGFIKIGPYTPLLTALQRAGYEFGKNLFVFSYDWRHSNFDSAASLHEFVQNQKVLTETDFTIVAHSMGGLVALLYARNHAQSDNVRKIIAVATPFQGSISTIKTLLTGPWEMEWFTSFASGLSATDITQVMLSFPSIYELLPTYGDCCFIIYNNDEKTPLDLLDLNVWYSWLPTAYKDKYGRDFIARGLQRRQDIKSAVDSVGAVIEGRVELVRIGNNLLTTPDKIVAKGFLKDYEWLADGNGDGTVTIRSSLNDDDRIVFAVTEDHDDIFYSDQVISQILYLLNPPRVTGRPHKTTDLQNGIYNKASVVVDGTKQIVAAVEFETGLPYKVTDSLAYVSVAVKNDRKERISGLKLTGHVTATDPSSLSLVFQETRGVYLAEFIVPAFRGVHNIYVDLPGLGTLREHYVALPPPEKSTIPRMPDILDSLGW